MSASEPEPEPGPETVPGPDQPSRERTGEECPAERARAGGDVTTVLAIDGPSGAGKSTVARAVAAKLGCAYLDTGAMYRAVTWHFLENQCLPAANAVDPQSGEGLDPHGERMRLLEALDLEITPEERVLVNGQDVTSHLRSQDVEHRVSAVSAMPEVRKRMRALQRQVARHGLLVADGRDMASVVFPKARWKVFLDAEPEERARRRHEDFRARGREISAEDVLSEMAVRDRLDSTRADAPLTRTADALYLDCTGMTIEATVAKILAAIDGESRLAGGDAAEDKS